MAKYTPLARVLSERSGHHWPTTFSELEAILGTRLPQSARLYPAWWSNNPSNNTMTRVWVDAGWKTENVDIAGERVTFRRVAEALSDLPPGMADGNGPPPFTSPPALLERLSPAHRALVRLMAEKDGMDEADVILHLLEQALDAALPSLRTDRAREAVARRGTMKPVDTEALVRDSRDMH
tara:strand:- start:248 stop:787 length:540 start_codon:yes stop_codon:yes gene_type:complete